MSSGDFHGIFQSKGIFSRHDNWIIDGNQEWLWILCLFSKNSSWNSWFLFQSRVIDEIVTDPYRTPIFMSSSVENPKRVQKVSLSGKFHSICTHTHMACDYGMAHSDTTEIVCRCERTIQVDIRRLSNNNATNKISVRVSGQHMSAFRQFHCLCE